MKRALRGLVRACHPEPTAAVTVVMTALAVSAGNGWTAVWVGLAVLAGQLSVGWSNDYVDRERDRRAGRDDKPLVRGDVAAPVVAAACGCALVAAVALSFAVGWRAALAHLAGVGAAWAYNLGVKATRWSPAPYAVGFGLLPAFVTLGLPGHPWPAWWVIAAGALIGVGAHFANVLPDIEGDLALGVRGLPQRLGAPRARLLSAALLTAASVLLAAGPGIDLVGAVGLAVAVVLVGAGVAARRLGRTPFLVTIAVAVLDVVLLIARGGGIG